MILTPEEYKKRNNIPTTSPQESTPSSVASGQIITAEEYKKRAGITTTSIQEPEKERTVAGKVLNFGKNIIKDAANTLVVKPITRATEAATRTLAPDSLAAKGYEVMADQGQGQDVKTLIGNYNVSTMKGFGQGGGKQLAGEALDAASYIPIVRGAGIAAQAVKQPFKVAALQTAKSLGKEGLIQGALGGAGKALQDNKTTGQVIGNTILGGALGGTLAGVLGAGGVALSRGLSKVPTEFISNKIDTSIRKIFDGTTADVGKIDEMAFKARKGLELLNKESGNLSIPDASRKLGSKTVKPFDLQNAKPNEVLSAVVELDKKIVSNARKAAEESSQKGVRINITQANETIKNAVERGEIPLTSARRMYRQLQDTEGDPVKVFDWVQTVNQKYKKKYERNTIDDTMLGKLADDTAEVLRRELNVITDRTGYAEAFGNNQELKRMLVAIAKKANKNVNFGDITSDAGLDAAISILTGNPAFMARTVGSALLRNVVSKLRNNRGVRLFNKAVKDIKRVPTDTRLPSSKSKVNRLELPGPSGKPVTQQQINLSAPKPKPTVEAPAKVIRRYENNFQKPGELRNYVEDVSGQIVGKEFFDDIDKEYEKYLIKEMRQQALDETAKNIDEAKLRIEFDKEYLQTHPGAQLKKFISRKEGSFEGFIDTDRITSPLKKARAIQRNAKLKSVMENAYADAPKAVRDLAKNQDAIMDKIREYEIIKQRIDDNKSLIKQERPSLVRQKLELKKEGLLSKLLPKKGEGERGFASKGTLAVGGISGIGAGALKIKQKVEEKKKGLLQQKQEEVKAQDAKKIPYPIYKKWEDGGKVYKLPSGTTVSEIHPKLVSAIKKTYEKHPELPKGLVEALLMKESTMGYDNKNRNPRIGKYAWLGGLVKNAKNPGALDELERNKIPYNVDTYEGALDAMAKFWKVLQKRNGNANATVKELYEKEYSSGKLAKADLDKFEEMYQFYKQYS